MEQKAGHNLAHLVPNKPDNEIADELRKEFVEISKPFCDLLFKAKKAGFEINFALGPTPTGFGITQLVIAKHF